MTMFFVNFESTLPLFSITIAKLEPSLAPFSLVSVGCSQQLSVCL